MTLTLVLKKGFYPKEYIYYVKYKSSMTYHSKAMANVEVSTHKQMNKIKGQTNGQTDRPKGICPQSIDVQA